MRVAIMQPYFLPYIGYFQLIAQVDAFIVYDRIKYTKKGWINRNRMLLNGKDHLFSIPLTKASDFLDISEREVSSGFDRSALLSKFREAYRSAPEFGSVFPWLSDVVNHEDANLFGFLLNSIRSTCDRLKIGSRIVVSSQIPIASDLSGKDRVIALCKAMGASEYVNPIGGVDLYDRDEFRAHGLSLRFLKSGEVRYPQFGASFIPSLSIVDVLMFNSTTEIQNHLRDSWEYV